jgi:hypothetical protein
MNRLLLLGDGLDVVSRYCEEEGSEVGNNKLHRVSAAGQLRVGREQGKGKGALEAVAC